ncbi:MAG TPA: response regulator [Gemmatimonadaceae bacterium]|nr:response regulator [Gemmatimonadaceae bacterium]
MLRTVSSERNAPAKPSVLVIDDESTIRAALRRFFKRRDWVFEEAEDGARGLAKLLTPGANYTAIISDLRMPGMSGMALHDELARQRPDLLDRLVFSTGDVASKDAAEFVQRTRCIIMEKPFELSKLGETLERIRAATPPTP